MRVFFQYLLLMYLIETIHENQGEIQKVDKTVLEELYTASKRIGFFCLESFLAY